MRYFVDMLLAQPCGKAAPHTDTLNRRKPSMGEDVGVNLHGSVRPKARRIQGSSKNKSQHHEQHKNRKSRSAMHYAAARTTRNQRELSLSSGSASALDSAANFLEASVVRASVQRFQSFLDFVDGARFDGHWATASEGRQWHLLLVDPSCHKSRITL